MHTIRNTLTSFCSGKALLLSAMRCGTLRTGYAEEARNLAKVEKDAKRKAELEKIAEICEWVPWNPPRTFHEALQAAWFIYLVYYLETNMTAQSPGRIDQKFYSWFKKDVVDEKNALHRRSQRVVRMLLAEGSRKLENQFRGRIQMENRQRDVPKYHTGWNRQKRSKRGQ